MPQQRKAKIATRENSDKQEIYTVRDWKEYVGESLLIVFSVFLALFFTEVINSQHEKNETKELIRNIRVELIRNKQYTAEQYAYDQKVLKSIDSALANPDLQKRIISNDEFHLNYIAPAGVLYRYLDNIAWDVAKSHNILSKIDFKEASLLTRIYEEQLRIMKVEDEVAKVMFNPESRKNQNAHSTLMLIRDNYHAWAVDRAPGLTKQYEQAIDMLKEE
jgi:hypothetical protein